MTKIKLLNKLSIAFLTAAALITVGCSGSENNENSNKEVNGGGQGSSENSGIPGTAEGSEEKIKVVLAPAVPELSCGQVSFGEQDLIFADRFGGYGLIKQGKNSPELSVTDDGGHLITLSLDDKGLDIKSDGINTDSFVANRHLIQLVGDKLYFDSSPVEYRQTSFSAYRLNEEYVVECTARGKYRLRDSDGKIVNKCTLKEGSGENVRVEADDNGFYVEGVDDGLFYNVFMLNGNSFYIDWDYVVYIDGSELVPKGFGDDHQLPAVSDPDPKGVIQPCAPPINYGDVNTDNENISSQTRDMLENINHVRRQYGLEELYGLELLDSAAAVRAGELKEDFSHTRPEGSEYVTAIDVGELWWHSGECIAKSTSESVTELFEKLMCTEDNRSVLLDPKMKYLSAACEKDGSSVYWEVLLFNDTYVPDV